MEKQNVKQLEHERKIKRYKRLIRATSILTEVQGERTKRRNGAKESNNTWRSVLLEKV